MTKSNLWIVYIVQNVNEPATQYGPFFSEMAARNAAEPFLLTAARVILHQMEGIVL